MEMNTLTDTLPITKKKLTTQRPSCAQTCPTCGLRIASPRRYEDHQLRHTVPSGWPVYIEPWEEFAVKSDLTGDIYTGQTSNEALRRRQEADEVWARHQRAQAAY